MGNPFFLGGAALVVAVAAAIGVAVAMGRGEDETVVSLLPRREARGTPTGTPGGVTGATARAATTLTVRAGPDLTFISLGVVARGTELQVVARSDSSKWLEVVFPPRSRLRGWVELEGVEFGGDVAALPVGGAEVFVLPVVPTALPTETPVGAPDLIPSDAFLSGDILVVTVTNNGTVDLLDGVIEVAVFDASMTEQLQGASAGPFSLAPGQSIDIETGFDVTDAESQRVVIVVDPGGLLGEGDYSNNMLVFVLSGPGLTGTPGAGTGTAEPGDAGTPAATETPTPTAP